MKANAIYPEHIYDPLCDDFDDEPTLVDTPAVMTRVVIESPYGSRVDGSRCTPPEIVFNEEYLKFAMRDSLSRNEAPFASHRMYTYALKDATPDERELGMTAGFLWGLRGADLWVVYEDFGVTPGMKRGIEMAVRAGIPVEYRKLYG